MPEKGKTFAGEVREETVAWSKDTYQLLKQAERRRAEQEAHQRAEAERRAAEEQQRIASRRYIGRDWEFER